MKTLQILLGKLAFVFLGGAGSALLMFAVPSMADSITLEQSVLVKGLGGGGGSGDGGGSGSGSGSGSGAGGGSGSGLAAATQSSTINWGTGAPSASSASTPASSGTIAGMTNLIPTGDATGDGSSAAARETLTQVQQGNFTQFNQGSNTQSNVRVLLNGSLGFF